MMRSLLLVRVLLVVGLAASVGMLGAVLTSKISGTDKAASRIR